MENLCIKQTKSTPTIQFDVVNNKLRIEGQSYPENAFRFYEPIFTWLDQYLLEVDKATVLEIYFHMPYINTSSSKCIMMLLEKMENAYQDGRKVAIQWYYNREDEMALECAEEFKEDLILPFELVALDNDE